MREENDESLNGSAIKEPEGNVRRHHINARAPKFNQLTIGNGSPHLGYMRNPIEHRPH